VKVKTILLGLAVILFAISMGGYWWVVEDIAWFAWQAFCWFCVGLLWVIHSVGWVIDNFHNWF